MSFPSWMCVYLHVISTGGINVLYPTIKGLMFTPLLKKRKKKNSKTLGGYFPTKNHEMFPKNPWRVFYNKNLKGFQ